MELGTLGYRRDKTSLSPQSCLLRGGTTGKPRQKALPRQLPRHKKPDSSRGPDPFQIYIPSPEATHSSPGFGLCSFLTGWPGPAPPVRVAGVREPQFLLSLPGHQPVCSPALDPRLLSALSALAHLQGQGCNCGGFCFS